MNIRQGNTDVLADICMKSMLNPNFRFYGYTTRFHAQAVLLHMPQTGSLPGVWLAPWIYKLQHNGLTSYYIIVR